MRPIRNQIVGPCCATRGERIPDAEPWTTMLLIFQCARLKYWTARSCFSAAARALNVPRFFRFPVLESFFFEYNR